MSAAGFRFPAEWEPLSGVMLAWPHAGTDWAPRLAEVETTYVSLAAAITRFDPLLLCCHDEAVAAHARALLRAAGVDVDARVRFLQVPYDDTWLRDSGPISLLDGDRVRLLDFRFTGWGGKYGAELDDALVAACLRAGAFAVGSEHVAIDFALEGGAIETDGAGTLLTTWACLHQRHPDASRAQLEQVLRDALRQHRVLMLDRGYLQGDDTDAHIDTLARFAPGERIVFQGCDDPDDIHHAELAAMRTQLAAFRTVDGRAYTLHELPWARPIYDGERRLAASYANYLVVDGAVLMPAYDDPADAAARAVLAAAHPGREIVPVPCRPLIWQNGSLHCITMQLPQGVLRV